MCKRVGQIYHTDINQEEAGVGVFNTTQSGPQSKENVQG